MHRYDPPPFCPYRRCRYHRGDNRRTGFSVRYGTYRTAGGRQIHRYRCRSCRRTFSDRSFSIDYWTHRRVDYRLLLALLSSCVGVCAAGRLLGVSAQTVLNRIGRLARAAACEQDRMLRRFPLREHLALDGFVTFCQSQYHPVDLNVLVGADSQLLYRWDYAMTRRRGQMTAAQRRERARRDRLVRGEPHPIRASVLRLAADGQDLLFGPSARRPLRIDTDLAPAYQEALQMTPTAAWRLGTRELVHRRTDSKAPRTRTNPLFPVNYLDRQIRMQFAEHVRESTRFGRNVNNQCERFALFQLAHNYLSPHRAHRQGALVSHAQVAGIPREPIDAMLARVFTRRPFAARSPLSWATGHLWSRDRMTPLKRGPERVPAYVWG